MKRAIARTPHAPFTTRLLAAATVVFFATIMLSVTIQAQSLLGTGGGLEGTVMVDNTTLATSGASGKWQKANSTQTISLETTVVRSGAGSLRILNTSTTGRRVYSPLFASVADGSRLILQYYRRRPAGTGQENQHGIAFPTEQTSSGYNSPAAADTWEKVTYVPTSTTAAGNKWALIFHRLITGGDNTLHEYIDDVAVYVSMTVDTTAPSSPTSVVVSGATTSSQTVSWNAASGGVDNGGYLVVRGIVDPTTVPNVNGIYVVNNTVASGQTVVFVGTGNSFTDTGLSAGTQYFYRVYTFDKAFNYSSAATGNGTTTARTATTTTLTSSVNPSFFGQAVTFTATVTGTGATGTMTFMDGSATLTCNEGAQPLTIDANGTANCTTSALAVGSHSITAVYSGDNSFNTSTSDILTQNVNPIPVIISEFRLAGAGGTTDEFIELYNTTDEPVNILNYQLTINHQTTGTSITLGTPGPSVIPPRGHYLVANATGYTLTAYAQPDLSPSGDFPTDAGVTLSNATNVVFDKVGFTTSPANSCEGTCLAPVSQTAQYSYARKFNPNGFPQDTDNNASDFWLVATNPSDIIDTIALLGAPGPENLSSPVNRTSQLKSSLIDPNPNSGPLGGENYKRDLMDGGTEPTAFGTLTLRRRFTNTTGDTVTRLRLRITNLTTINSPGGGASTGQADLRALTSIMETVSVMINEVATPVTLQKATLEEPPAQARGGGYNSSLLVDLANLPGGTLAHNGTVEVNITFGVAKRGSFSLAFLVEAFPGPSGSAMQSTSGTSMKSATTRSKPRN